MHRRTIAGDGGRGRCRRGGRARRPPIGSAVPVFFACRRGHGPILWAGRAVRCDRIGACARYRRQHRLQRAGISPTRTTRRVVFAQTRAAQAPSPHARFPSEGTERGRQVLVPGRVSRETPPAAQVRRPLPCAPDIGFAITAPPKPSLHPQNRRPIPCAAGAPQRTASVGRLQHPTASLLHGRILRLAGDPRRPSFAGRSGRRSAPTRHDEEARPASR